MRYVAPALLRRLAVDVRNSYVYGRARARMAQGGEHLCPEFLIIGAMKAGTTSLFSYLSGHPKVVPPIVKEVRYFDYGWSRPWAWYLANFPRKADCPVGAMTGEASPTYVAHSHGAERVASVLPNVRLIVLLRDPVTRAISHYYHAVRAGFETRPMDVALWSDDSWRTLDTEAPEVVKRTRGRSYIAFGLYAEQLERWFEHFDRSQILVLQSEALRAKPSADYAKVLRFLGLEEIDLGVPRHEYVGQYDKPDTQIVSRLRDVFAEPNRRLSALLGMDFPWPTN